MAERIPHADTETRQAFQRMEARVSGGADPGHSHTGASLSGIDISADTNLAVTAPIVLTGDTLSLDQAGIDHGTIGGLMDDDHTIYLLADGTRDLTGNLAVDDAVTVDGRDLSVDGAKLDLIEAGADVTDAVNVAAAGAAMAGGAYHDGFSDFVGAEHVALPAAIADVLTDHNLAAHTALGLFDQHADVDHDQTTNYAANQHVVLPGLIAAVLTDHNLAAHTALGLFDAHADVDHNQTTNYVADQHVAHADVSIVTAATSGISGGGTIAATRNLALNINGLTGESGIVAADTLAFYDADGVGNRKVAFSEFKTALAIHAESHTAQSHSDITSTGAQIETAVAASHAEAHSVVSHNDTTGTGAELNTLTDNSMADALHRHSELSASDGTPDATVAVDAAGAVTMGGTLGVTGAITGPNVSSGADPGHTHTIASLPGACLVNRGDPAAFDYWIGGGFTADGTARDLDLVGDGKIPAGCYAVLIRFIVISSVVANGAYFYKKGDTNFINILQITPVNTAKHEAEGIVFVDANGKLTYDCNANVTTLNMSVKGWFI